VGCADGSLGRELIEAGWRVTGIEMDEHDAAAARATGLHVIHGSAEEVIPTLTEKYDVTLLADVLEHLADPVALLRKLAPRVTRDGIVLASIPNIAHLAVRLQLLSGRFDYADRGPLDRTHLRFFTKKTVRTLFRDAGYMIEGITVTPSPLEVVSERAGLPNAPTSLERLNVTLARLWPGALAYQFLVIARPLVSRPLAD
jgi:2-polyprenyl-3-methyl-5-hydroxy-6-metoxy-1,4-benzoquinol methylase